MPNTYDNQGKLIGSTRKNGDGSTSVFNNRNQPAGTVNKTGTWGNRGTRVSSTGDPGLLWPKR